MSRQRWVVSMAHRAAVDTTCLVSNPVDQGGEMPLAFVVIHNDGMRSGFGQSSLQRRIDILAQTRSHSHLDKITSVKSHEIFFDHRESFECGCKAV
ncbi:hypothetical protein FM111_01745 [Brevundimonas diminuta 3F5N]|uniref:Uncharacterized protein n=1 Tax=Brevundimonas diminuta 3F5N TaxID=1255603 RepID=A0A1R4F0A2_BREDI|nr:hypothetical protein FM111_01745 [Brevundimonas diminuta 3F5N]